MIMKLRKSSLLLIPLFSLIALILIFNDVSVYAKGSGSSAGITFLHPSSAEAASMAEACTALSGAAYVMHYNPASLASLNKTEISAMYQNGLADDNLTTLILAKPFSFAFFGAEIMYYTTGEVSLYDASGTLVKEVGQKDIAVIVGSAERFGKFSIGFNFKYLTTELFGKNAFAFAADVGGQYDISKTLTTGAAIQNLGTKITYIEKDEDLPLLLRTGISWRQMDFGRDIVVSFDLPYYFNEQEIFASIGAEAVFEKQLTFRIGYRVNLSDPENMDEKFNLGWGLIFNKFRFNHSVTITDKLNTPQRFSVSTKF
jgi:hypothetical protein